MAGPRLWELEWSGGGVDEAAYLIVGVWGDIFAGVDAANVKTGYEGTGGAGIGEKIEDR